MLCSMSVTRPCNSSEWHCLCLAQCVTWLCNSSKYLTRQQFIETGQSQRQKRHLSQKCLITVLYSRLGNKLQLLKAEVSSSKNRLHNTVEIHAVLVLAILRTLELNIHPNQEIMELWLYTPVSLWRSYTRGHRQTLDPWPRRWWE